MSTLNPWICSEENEKALLGAVLSDPRSVHRVFGRLEPHHFFFDRHRYLWRAIEACVEGGADPGVLEVIAKLDGHGCLDAVGQTYIRNLTEDFVSAGAVEQYAEVVRTHYQRRRLRDAADDILQGMNEGELDVKEARQLYESAIQDSAATHSRGRQLADVAGEVRERIERVRAGDERAAFDTDIDPVDRALHGGFQRSRLYMVAARPKHGKTSLAVAMTAALMVRHGFTVDWWYTDGPAQDIAVEYAAYLSRVPSHFYREKPGKLNRRQIDRFENARDRFERWDCQVHAAGAPDPDDIVAHATTRAAATERYCVVVDYVQQCDAGITGESATRLNIEYASKRLSGLRAEMPVIVLALAQLNRQADKGDGSTVPHYSTLKGSGQLEQDVNHLLVWHRPDAFKEGADAEDKRLGMLHHQLSKHTTTALERVDAKLAINAFDTYSEQKMAQERQADREVRKPYAD